MKSLIVWGGMAVLGIAIGAGTTVVEKNRATETFVDRPAGAEVDKAKVAEDPTVYGKKRPKVELVDGGIYDFGSMERYAKMSHVFEMKNVGDGPLILTPGRTTCKCTISKVDNRVAKPGESTRFTVEWTGQTLTADPEFEQTIEIKTNDPENELIRFKIRGYVTETIRALPDTLALGRVSSNVGAKAEFRLYGFRSDKIDILETAWENAEIAEYFEMSFQPLPEAEVKEEKGATCGLLATVKVKPGLPLGPIDQTIRVRANVDKEAVIHLPIKGLTTSDIIIAASGVTSSSGYHFNPNTGLLVFGALERSESASAVLNLFVRGPHRHETRLSVGSIDPQGYLKVHIGPPKELNNGKAIKYMVTIEIPPGLEPVNRLGSSLGKFGRIVIDTTHPQTKRVPINVKFAID